jgi:hypothetical protein
VYRRIATRYDKPAGSFVKLVAIALKRWETLQLQRIAEFSADTMERLQLSSTIQ